MAESRSALSPQWANPLLAVLVGVVFARAFDRPVLPERPEMEHSSETEALSTKVDALLTHDPLPLLPADRSGPRSESEAELVPPEERGRTLVLACLLRGGPWPADRERRIQMRTAVVRGIMDSGFVAEEPRYLQIARAGEWKVPYDTFAFPGEAAPFERIITLWIDELRLRTSPLREFEGLVQDLGVDECDLKILGPTSSGGLKRWMDDAETAQVCGSYLMYSPFATVAKLRRSSRQEAGKEEPAEREVAHRDRQPLQVVHRIGTDEELASLLVKELRERIPTLMSLGSTRSERDKVFSWFHGLPRVLADSLKWTRFIPKAGTDSTARVVLLCESDSLYGRTWTENLTGACKQQQEKDPSYGRIRFETYPYITVVDGVGRKHPGDDANDRSVTQIDYIERMAAALAEGPEVDAIGILGSDTHDILQLLGTLRSRFPAAVFFTTDMDAKFLEPEHRPYTRNLLVASHGELSVEQAKPILAMEPDAESPPPSDEPVRGPVHFRDAYQVAVYRTAAELASRRLPTAGEWAAPRLYEIGAGRAIALNLPGTKGIEQARPGRVYLARLAQAVPWLDRSALHRVVGLTCGLLGLWVLVRSIQHRSAATLGSRLRAVWKPVVLIAFAGLFLKTVGAGPADSVQEGIDKALCFVFLLAVAMQLPRRGLFVLAVILLFFLTRSDEAPDLESSGPVFHPLVAALFLGLLFFVAASNPARREEPQASERALTWVRRALIGAILCVLFLRVVMGLAEASLEAAIEPVEFFMGVSVWPTVILRTAGIGACVFGIQHIRSRLLHEHQSIAERIQAVSSTDAQSSHSMPWSWIFGLPTKGKPIHDLRTAWLGLGMALASPFWLAFRLLGYVFAYLCCMAPLYKRFPIPAPVRGELSYLCERASIFLLVVFFLALFFYVLESSFLAMRVAARMRDDSVRLPEALLESEGVGRGPLSDKLVRLELIERITRRCDRMVLWPVSVAALMALSRSSVFDRWCWPASLVLTFVIFFSLLALCALNSQRLASGERRAVQLAMLKMKTGGTDDESHRRRLQERLDRLRSGAFQPFYRHPLLRSLGLPAAAVVVTKALEMGWISI